MERVSLNSKSNSSLATDSPNYPKDLDPFGEDDGGGTQSGQKTTAFEVIKPSAPNNDPSYPGTLDPFAGDDDDEQVKEMVKDNDDDEGVKSHNNSIKSNKRVSGLFANQEKDSFNISSNNGGVSLETSITSRASDYDESLDPFGGDNDNDDSETITTIKTKADDRKSMIDTSRKPGFVDDRSVTSDNLSIKSEKDFYSNQNSPVPVPPRRKHRNVSPSTKSLNRASYSASSLERDPLISSPSTPDPNRLSTIETDSYLSHSTSNLSIRSTSPITTVRSSPMRSRKKRRAPNPPGFPPSSILTSPISPPANTSPTTNITTEPQNSTFIETTYLSTNDSMPETENITETGETTPISTNPEPAGELNTTITTELTDSEITTTTKESNNETPLESIPDDPVIETEKENDDTKEKGSPDHPEINITSESIDNQKLKEATEDDESHRDEKTKEPESHTCSASESKATDDSF